jgi:hypothetical protein
MFGMTAVTAFELEAERRRELATSWKPMPTVETAPRRARRSVSLRRLVSAPTPVPATNWEDVRT